MSNAIYHTISTLAYHADMRTRRDLVDGIIIDERDYVSNLTNRIRDFYLHVGLSCFSHAQTLPNAVSHHVGCDALIVCNMGSESKICLFEAKWPRLTQSGSYSWDYIQRGSSISHFSDQLQRQAAWSKYAAIWELFISESPFEQQPRPLIDDWGSTCIWHNIAKRYNQTRDINSVWKSSELTNIILPNPRGFFSSNWGKNIREMLLSVLYCKAGHRLDVEDGHISLPVFDGEEPVRIPAGLERPNEDVISQFCMRYGIRHFLSIMVKP